MQVSEPVQCPFCSQEFELVIDTSVDQQSFVTDCEICCRPMSVTADCRPGEIINLSITSD